MLALGLLSGRILSGGYCLGAYRLGAYCLVAYCMGAYCLGPDFLGPAAWEPPLCKLWTMTWYFVGSFSHTASRLRPRGIPNVGPISIANHHRCEELSRPQYGPPFPCRPCKSAIGRGQRCQHARWPQCTPPPRNARPARRTRHTFRCRSGLLGPGPRRPAGPSFRRVLARHACNRGSLVWGCARDPRRAERRKPRLHTKPLHVSQILMVAA